MGTGDMRAESSTLDGRAPGCDAASVAGIVYIVGAGPGDPELITVRGAACLGRAEVVVADRLASPRLLARAPAGAERIVRGARRSSLDQDEINRILVERARAGRVVVRLKGGDPLLFGRGGEEAEALAAAGIAYEIVPGVTAAMAAPAYAGIPLTHRGVASAVVFATAHETDAKAGARLDWAAFADPATTVVLYMSVTHLDEVAAKLIAAGRAPSTPAAIVEEGTLPSQRTIVATLADLPAKARAAGVRPPALTVVGEVVRLRASLAWFERRPLHGARVVVTRAAEAAEATVERLAALGAEVIAAPTLSIAPPADEGAIAAAAASIDKYRLIAFASQNAVDYFMRRLRDARALAGKTVAAVGERTAAALLARGIRADIVAADATAEGLAAALAGVAGPALLPRAAEGREALAEALAARGVEVDAPAAYRTVAVPPEQLAAVAAEIARGAVDAVTFGSPRTAEALLAALPDPSTLAHVIVAAIGPTTAAALARAGVRVDVVPPHPDFAALVDALVPPLRNRLAARPSL